MKKEDYPKYCFENLPQEYQRLRKKGGTGTEAFIFAKNYENRLNYKKLKEALKKELYNSPPKR